MSCPICAKPVDPAYRPFCSRRCADIDLARWFNESYRIAEPATGEEESADLPPDAVPERPPGRPQ